MANYFFRVRQADWNLRHGTYFYLIDQITFKTRPHLDNSNYRVDRLLFQIELSSKPRHYG
jgi:hypothetical protein